ncbi:MAG: 1-acyl-sn-glycerol-3-phosphate acyltransferase [Candidatus Cloacimonetes bacterium]|nr:1-acyl-sn-glycerol-3-phosphate acyltransferase [Candidatus Cloacimonadota bacterium]
MKKANSLIASILKLFFRPALFLVYRFRFDRSTSNHIKRPCVILSNHQTVIDQFALSMGFKFAINYVASDTIFRHGFLSKVMIALVRPIAFSKGNSDFIAVKNMISVIKDGGCVAMFPSGNRSFFGKENKIVNGIGKLVKKLDAPLVLVQIKGGYNTKPRWKKKTNKGKMTASVVKIIPIDELKTVSNDELDNIIQNNLNFNEFDYNKQAKIVFSGKHKAEYLESVLFYCPQCFCFSSLYSKGNEFFCQDCQMRVRINDLGFFERVHNADKIPETILEWGELQLNFIKNYDYSPYFDKFLFSDNNIKFLKAERAKKEHLIAIGSINFYSDKICIVANHSTTPYPLIQEFLLKDITFAIQGVRKLTIYKGNEVYAIIASHKTNLFKYMVCGYHLRNKILDIKEEYYGY